MSGGHFNYTQSVLEDMAEEIERLIETNGETEWRSFSPKTLAEFKRAVTLLRQAYIYAQRIDWLVSADDGEDTFHERLKEDLQIGNQTNRLYCKAVQ